MSRIPQLTRRFVGLVALAMPIACGGCANLQKEPTDEARDESFTEAARYQRRGENTTLPFSISDRGRSIEQDLGVR